MKKTKTPQPVIPATPSVSTTEVEGSFQKQLTILDDKFKRALADYQNLERNQHQSKLIEKGKIISKFLPLLDGLELTHQHTQDPVTEMMVKEFKKVLNELGVGFINSDPGTQFNSHEMDCVEVVAGEKDKVVKIVQPGYQLGDVVLRPARVEVGSGASNRNPATAGSNES